MPTSHIVSRIQSIENRISEIQKIGQAQKKETPKIEKSANGDTFGGILDEVMKSKQLDTLNLLDSTSQDSPSNLVSNIIDVYKKDGIMPTSKPKPLPKNLIKSFNPGTWDNTIQQAAQIHNLDPRLIHAVIQAESAYNPNAVSHAGAEGLMQLMPSTAKRVGVANSFDPTQNIFGGATVLRQMLDRYDGDLIKSLAAYNAGPEAVDRANGIPNYKETQEYVPRVLNFYYNLNHQ